ncbi:MAG: shikimate kinase, partial [Bacteroidaceae bacterium]|nr:shikimate kinase [Bacteroidaceae bacterium]
EFDNVLIATGGGTPCFFDNMAYMNERGIAVFLSCSVETICHRLLVAKVKRPLVEGCLPEELPARVTAMLEERLPYYRQARYTFPSDEYEKATVLALATEQLRTLLE